MFYPGRMNLTELKKGFRLLLTTAKNYCNDGRRCDGKLAYQSSLSPERLWGDFYATLLDEMRRSASGLEQPRKSLGGSETDVRYALRRYNSLKGACV